MRSGRPAGQALAVYKWVWGCGWFLSVQSVWGLTHHSGKEPLAALSARGPGMPTPPPPRRTPEQPAQVPRPLGWQPESGSWSSPGRRAFSQEESSVVLSASLWCCGAQHPCTQGPLRPRSHASPPGDRWTHVMGPGCGVGGCCSRLS